MLPLIPAIILLLLQGPAGPGRLPRDLRLPESWLVLEQADVSMHPRAEAALAQLLEYVSGRQSAETGRPIVARRDAEDEGTPARRLSMARPAVDARLRDGSQECRRSRDGPDSIV